MAINVKQNINGFLSGKKTITGKIRNKEQLVGSLGISTSGVTEQYGGEYEVTPRIVSQVLQTKQKVMTDNLTIKEIPFFDVSNTSGGTTVYIGKEIE